MVCTSVHLPLMYFYSLTPIPSGVQFSVLIVLSILSNALSPPSADPAVVAAVPARGLYWRLRLRGPLCGLRRARGELRSPRPRIRRARIQQKCEYTLY